MENHLYGITVYVPYPNYDMIDKDELGKICKEYDVCKHAGRSCGLLLMNDAIEQDAWSGISYSSDIRQDRLLEFLNILPPYVIIERVEDMRNMKSNGWIQTDDLNTKYYDEDHYSPCFYQVHIPDKLEYKQNPNEYNGVSETGTQTDFIVDEFAGSELATECEDKYDTEYSLEMWDYYRKESIVYENPYVRDYDLSRKHQNDVKKSLSPFEEKIIEICKSFEGNIKKFIKWDYEVSV